jgi:hypothetical protein
MPDKIEGVEALASELEKSLDEEAPVEDKAESVETPPTPAKVVFKGQEKTVEELEKEWDEWQRDYTVKTQTAAEERRRAEDVLRQAEGYYQAAQVFAQQRQPVQQDEEEPDPYLDKVEGRVRKYVEPIAQQVEYLGKVNKEMALRQEIERAQAQYPQADPEEILIRAIADFKSTGRVNLVELARQSHEKNSRVAVTYENIPPEWRQRILKEELDKSKSDADKQTIMQDSGKAPGLEPEKLKYDQTKDWLEAQLTQELSRKK